MSTVVCLLSLADDPRMKPALCSHELNFSFAKHQVYLFTNIHANEVYCYNYEI